MKNRIRRWILRLLGVAHMQKQIELLQLTQQGHQIELTQLRNGLGNQRVELKQLASSIKVVLDISHPRNINHREQSWGMIVSANPNGESQIHFFQIPRSWDQRQINEFVRSFEQLDVYVDAPRGFYFKPRHDRPNFLNF